MYNLSIIHFLQALQALKFLAGTAHPVRIKIKKFMGET